MPGATSGRPPLQVGSPAYTINYSTGVLLTGETLPPVGPSTELLIGVRDVLITPDTAFENTELFSYPGSQPPVIRIVHLDSGTQTVSILYQGEAYLLRPGDSLSLPATKNESSTGAVTIGIRNYGRILGLGTFVSPGGPN